MSVFVELENIGEHLTLTEDADPGAWPLGEIEIDPTSWSPPEPDVGISYFTLDNWDESYTLAGMPYQDFDTFTAALHVAIAGDISESLEEFRAVVAKLIQAALDSAEPEGDD